MKPTTISNNQYVWAVTGTYHGALITAPCEGYARKAFHAKYNGESIVHIRRTDKPLGREEVRMWGSYD